jgi:hypothetical protein
MVELVRHQGERLAALTSANNPIASSSAPR